jgi:hypothetical protein
VLDLGFEIVLPNRVNGHTDQQCHARHDKNKNVRPGYLQNDGFFIGVKKIDATDR